MRVNVVIAILALACSSQPEAKGPALPNVKVGDCLRLKDGDYIRIEAFETNERVVAARWGGDGWYSYVSGETTAS